MSASVMTNAPKMKGPVGLYRHNAMGHDAFVADMVYWGNSDIFRYNVCKALECPQAGNPPAASVARQTREQDGKEPE